MMSHPPETASAPGTHAVVIGGSIAGLLAARVLADHFAEVPLFLFAFVQIDPTGASIFPAVWSAQLAARAEGIGSSLTSVLAVWHRDEVLEILGVRTITRVPRSPPDVVGVPTGRWGVAPRRPAHEVAYRNQWGTPPGFEAPEPLWHPDAEEPDRTGELLVW